MKKFASVKREEYLLFQECSVGCVADAKLDKNDRMKKKSGLINHGLTYVKGMALFQHFQTDHFYSGVGDI